MQVSFILSGKVRLCIGILLAVILTAPTMRENYYYSSYFNSYRYLLFGLSYVAKDRGNIRRKII